jgi:hypothetical protein
VNYYSVDQKTVLFVSGELAITSSGLVLELLFPRHVSRADVPRDNKK